MKKLLSSFLCFLLCTNLTPVQTQRAQKTQTPAANETISLGARYELEAEHGGALYITPDLAFERVHFFFSAALEEIEEKRLSHELGEILDDLEEGLRNARSRAREGIVGELLARNEAHIKVARCLLNDHAPPSSGPVEEEMKLILAADSTAVSPVMGYLEDYTQYIARGHYTKSEGMERYFRAMTWLGRAAFYVESNPAAGIDEESATRLTAQAMLLIAIGSRIKSVSRRLTKFESAMTALVGESDDLTLAEADSLISHVAGARWTELENESDYATIIGARQVEQARAWMRSNARRPRILGAHAAEGRVSPPLSIRVIGQRFSVDSYTFQNLTFDRVKDLTLSEAERRRRPSNTPSPPAQPAPALPITLSVTKQKRQVRGMPRGLDFLMALGSKLARAELARGLDDRYAGYAEQSERLRTEIPAMLESSDSFTAHYLRAVQNALRDETPLSLNSAMGAWILLRYDLSAYIKQSYTSIPKGLAPRRPAQAILPPIYVAPAASVFKELSRSVESVAEHMESAAPARALRLIEALKLLASRAGSGALANDEAREIFSIMFRQQNNGSSVVITDAHSDPISGEVLQAALGAGRNSPFTTKDGKQATGVIFTCYEFRRPASQRMNDEQWRKELKSNGARRLYFAPGL
ncbi:MAG TPA: DUF3160 domain-containing protein [Blastocatellia bacterium]|nr:DUF3160 domain-containing protein [Blastocatellia bacterium]